MYIEIPKRSETDTNRNMVCKLLKVLYGLKQSSWLWYEKLSNFLLQKLDLSQKNVDYSIFVINAGLNGLELSIFMDDIKIIAPKKSEITQRVKAEVITAFLMVDIGPISFYPDLNVEQDLANQTIKLLQPAYIDKVLSRF